MKSRSFLLLLIERALVAGGAEEEAGDPGRGAAHHIADRAEVSLRRALDNELIMHRADDETVAGRMGGRLSIPLPSGTAVPAPLPLRRWGASSPSPQALRRQLPSEREARNKEEL